MSIEALNVSDLSFEEVPQFPDFADIAHESLYSIALSNNTTRFTHGLHRFPAKFIPQLPAWGLDNFASPSSVVLDPFMGSGTTLVEALVREIDSVGLDIDPLARFIAKAKTTRLDDDRVAQLARRIRFRWTAPASRLDSPMPGVENFGHWFAPGQWAWLQSLLDVIDGLNCSEEESRFLLALFSSTLRWVSNADDQSQKTYVSGTLKKVPPDVRATFWRFFDRVAQGMSELNDTGGRGANVDVPEDGDATRIPLEDATIDLAVTSPPYLDSVDYMYNMMLEYFWLGPRLGVPTRAAFNRLRRAPVGAKNPTASHRTPEILGDLAELESLSPARRRSVDAYFAMMDQHFGEMSRVLKPDARYVMVVGNSGTRTGALPVHDALVRVASSAGFTLERAFGYRIRRHYMKFPRAGRGGIILLDWVLVLRNGSSASAGGPLPLTWLTAGPDEVAC